MTRLLGHLLHFFVEPIHAAAAPNPSPHQQAAAITYLRYDDPALQRRPEMSE